MHRTHSPVKFRDRFPTGLIHGRLSVEIYRRLTSGEDHLEDFRVLHEGPEVKLNLGNNLIVDGAREELPHLIAYVDADKFVQQMKWGTGGETAPGVARVPVVSETDLDTPIADPAPPPIHLMRSTTYALGAPLPTTEVTFTAELDYGDANGNTINEEGLFNGEELGVDLLPKMWAIKCFPGLNKTVEWRFVFSHTIIF